MRNGILLAMTLLLSLAPLVHAELGSAEVMGAVEAEVGTAPPYCGPEACVQAACANTYVADGGCAASSSCGRGQWWAIRGGYASGNATVNFTVSCGGEVVISCKADLEGVQCRDGPAGPGNGEFGCFHEVLEGIAEDIAGRCVDPANPEILYLAVPKGTPYEISKYAVRAVADGEREAFRFV